MGDEKEVRIPLKRVRWGRIVALVVVLLALSFLVIRPGVIGFGVVDDSNLTNDTTAEEEQKKETKSLSKQELVMEVERLRTNISSYLSFQDSLLRKLDEKSDEVTDCKVENQRLQGDVDAAKKESLDKDAKIAEVEQSKNQVIDLRVQELTAVLSQDKVACEQNLVAKEANVSALQVSFNEFGLNTALSVCCKAKIDNSNIQAYDIVNNKVVCLEQGGNALSCSFS